MPPGNTHHQRKRPLCLENDQGETFFVGKDVAETLGYKNTSDELNKQVDSDDKGVAKCDTLGGEQNLVFINESRLYSLVLSSKPPQAKMFKRYVDEDDSPKQGLIDSKGRIQQAIFINESGLYALVQQSKLSQEKIFMTNDQGETFFVGKDVAEALGYSDPRKAI